MANFWQDNLTILKQKDPALAARVQSQVHKPVGEVLPTPAGLPTLRFFPPADRPEQGEIWAYNEQDPSLDVVCHLSTVTSECHGLILLIGMGLGYAALTVLRERPTLGMMVIVEPEIDLFITALHSVDLCPLLLSPKTHFLIGKIDFEQLGKIVQRIAALEDTHLLRHVPSFQWQKEAYETLDRQVLMQINQFNASGGTTRVAGERFMKNRMANLSQLRHSSDLAVLKDLFVGKPAILVASGPSLDQSIDELKKVVGHCVLFAVDAAMAPLLKAGIMPDFVSTIDFHYVNFEKVAPFTASPTPWPFSLITTIKGVPHIPKRLATRHRFWTFHDDRAETWLHESLDIQQLIPPSASVAHLSLGCALLMGCDPIILVGQDLAYTSNTASHAAGSIVKGDGAPQGQELFAVAGLDGGLVSSDRGLLCFQKVFEDIFAGIPDRAFWNASAAGAHIAGAKRITLPEVTSTLLAGAIPVQIAVDEAVQKGRKFPVSSFLSSTRKDLSAIAKLQKKFAEFQKFAAPIRHAVEQLRKKRAHISEFAKLPPDLAEKIGKLDQMSNNLDAQSRFGNQVVELTFPVLSDNDRQRIANDQILEKEGYLPWLGAEIDRIDTVNSEKQKACALFGGLLSGLVTHLDQEGKFSCQAEKQPGEDAFLALARLYLVSSDFQLAREWVDKALALPKASAEAFVLAGRIRSSLLDFEGAEEAWRKAILLSPAAASLVSQIRQNLANGWIEIAQRHGTPGSSREDDHPRLLPLWLQRAARLLAEEKDLPPLLLLLWQQHLALMEQWLAAERYDLISLVLTGWDLFGGRLPELFAFRARCAEAQGDNCAALTCMEEAVRLDHGQPQWLAKLARLFLEAGRFDEGLDALKQAVALDRQTASLWEELGDTLRGMEDPVGAISAFEQCFLALPERVELLTKMGDCYLALGQITAAISAYEAVLVKQPNNNNVGQRLEQVRALAAKFDGGPA